MARHSAARPRTAAAPKAAARPRRRGRGAGPAAAPRPVDGGDTASLRPAALENDRVDRATARSETVAAMALADVLAHHAQGGDGGTRAMARPAARPGRRRVARRGEVAAPVLFERPSAPKPGVDPDLELAPGWRDGGYPYRNLMSRKQLREAEVPPAGGVAEAAGLGQGHRPAGGDPVRGPRRGRQGRHDQALHGTPEPARCARGGAGKAERGRTRPVVLPALHLAPAHAAARSCCSTAAGTTAPASSA
jgi:hypothetical protein